MISTLRKWWGGSRETQMAESRERVAAGPETLVVPVNYELTIRGKAATEQTDTQVITVDHDIKELKRALFFAKMNLRSGKVRTIKVGPTCEKCGQAGLAYRRNDETRILVCDHVERGLIVLFLERLKSYGFYDDYPLIDAFPPVPNTLVIAGVPIESIECGRNLLMSLRMRYCWFD